MGVIPGVELCKPFGILVGAEGGGGNRRHRRDRTTSSKSENQPLTTKARRIQIEITAEGGGATWVSAITTALIALEITGQELKATSQRLEAIFPLPSLSG